MPRPGADVSIPLAPLARALDAAPLDVALHARMRDALQAAGDDDGFAAHQLAVAAFDALDGTPPATRALALYNLATVYAMKGRHDDAVRWYRHTLAANPALASAHQNLAALYATLGRAAEARAHREHAYRLQRVFVEPALDTDRPGHAQRLLIVGVGGGTGNVPLDALLPFRTTTRIKYAIDYAADAEDAQLPPHDLAFNAIGDPDIAAPLAARLARFASRSAVPVLNPPDAIAHTHRDHIAARLAALPDVLVPPCVRIADPRAPLDVLLRRLAQEGVAFPLLLRPAGAHGGDGVTRHAAPDTLAAALARLDGPAYATAYRDTRNPDGYFRKYRAIFVDRVPYPYHLAISSHWLVHYFSADMTSAPWKLDEECRFLDDPRAALGDTALRALAAIGRQLDLDYGGVDFALTDDGRVVVFEANATMLVHREAADGPLAHKNPHIERIARAFARMLDARHDTSPASPAPAQP
jgi:glutathione synthase/RimK-type ligase-like ATP-grasp enzyme